jgi:tetratricopeptide (TPR) repeat protein
VAREGLQRHPNYPSARMTLGRAYLDTGEWGRARAEFEHVLKGAPDNILASRYLAECLEHLGDTAGALVRYQSTLLLAPGDKHVMARVAALGSRDRTGPAVPPPPPPVPAAPEARPEPEPVPAAEPPPIPLVAVDTPMELERPEDREGGVVPSQAAVTAGEAGSSGDAGVSPAPIPVSAAPEEFELERPYEAPSPRWTDPEAVPPPPPVQRPPDAVARPVEPMTEFDFDGGGPPAASPDLTSPTLAELYFNQGFTDKAIEVYRQILEREPGNLQVQARLKELEALSRHLEESPAPAGPAGIESGVEAAGAPTTPARRQAIERTILRLEGFLAAIRRE